MEERKELVAAVKQLQEKVKSLMETSRKKWGCGISCDTCKYFPSCHIAHLICVVELERKKNIL